MPPTRALADRSRLRRTRARLGAVALSLALAVAVGFALTIPTAEAPAPDAPPSSSPQTAAAPNRGVYPFSPPPNRDLYELARRLRQRTLQPLPRLAAMPAEDAEPGHRREFVLTDLERNIRFTRSAILRHATPRLLLYVEEDQDVPLEDLRRAAGEFENRIYPLETSMFGPDHAGRWTVVHARIPGVAGYFSEGDRYPKVVNPFSNEGNMVYMSLLALAPGNRGYLAVLAHEFQHALHSLSDPDEEVWVNEGLSELASDLAGFGTSGFLRLFLQDPDLQLTAWATEPSRGGPYYGAAYLYMRYLHDQYGGEIGLSDLVAETADGEAGVDAFLARRSPGRSFDSTFLDWVAANALDSPPGPYGYPKLDVRIVPRGRLEASAPRSEQVHQYGARYYELPENLEGARLVFTGTAEARLFPAEPRSGQTVWWSQRGDAIDSTLTREFDLTGLTGATLSFWTWYDIEQGYDWAYVEVSTDGGHTWQVLSGRGATSEDLIGNSYGPGYTGSSGTPQPGWVQEAIDLSPFAGQKIRVRFEYVTDEAVNLRGLFLDDIAVPQAGFLDDAEGEDLWETQGFVRTKNRLAQRFSVRLLYGGDQPVVIDVPLDAGQSGHATIPPRPAGTQRAYVAVAALAPLTLEPAPFTLAVESAPP